MLSLVVAQGLSLAAPNLQGRIFDSIIHFLQTEGAGGRGPFMDVRTTEEPQADIRVTPNLLCEKGNAHVLGAMGVLRGSTAFQIP